MSNIRESLYQCIDMTTSAAQHTWMLFAVNTSENFSIDCHINFTDSNKKDYINIEFASGTCLIKLPDEADNRRPYYKVNQANLNPRGTSSNILDTKIIFFYTEENNIRKYYMSAKLKNASSSSNFSIQPTIKKNIHYGNFEDLLTVSAENVPTPDETIAEQYKYIITYLVSDTFDISNGRYIEANDIVYLNKLQSKNFEISQIEQIKKIATKYLYITSDGKIDSAHATEISENGVATNNLSATSNLTVGGTASITGNTTISGITSILNNLSTTGNLTVDGNTTISGDASILKGLSIAKNLTVSGTAGITGDVTAGAAITATGVVTAQTFKRSSDNREVSYYDTATAANNILAGSNSGTQITYAPYSSDNKAAGRLYSGTADPTNNTRLNYDGYLYATKLYSAGSETLTDATQYVADVKLNNSSIVSNRVANFYTISDYSLNNKIATQSDLPVAATNSKAGLLKFESATVATQSQSTKFLREDGQWVAPSYGTHSNDDTWNANALNVAGYVAAPSSSTKNKVWKTDNSGNPGWRDDANTWNANALNVAGYVAAPTSSTANKVWKTDASGNPAWRDDANSWPTNYLVSASKSGSTLTVTDNAGNSYSLTDTNDNTTYSTFTSSTNGLVPAPGSGNTSKFLRGDGTWQTVSAGGNNYYYTSQLEDLAYHAGNEEIFSFSWNYDTGHAQIVDGGSNHDIAYTDSAVFSSSFGVNANPITIAAYDSSNPGRLAIQPNTNTNSLCYYSVSSSGYLPIFVPINGAEKVLVTETAAGGTISSFLQTHTSSGDTAGEYGSILESGEYVPLYKYDGAEYYLATRTYANNAVNNAQKTFVILDTSELSNSIGATRTFTNKSAATWISPSGTPKINDIITDQFGRVGVVTAITMSSSTISSITIKTTSLPTATPMQIFAIKDTSITLPRTRAGEYSLSGISLASGNTLYPNNLSPRKGDMLIDQWGTLAKITSITINGSGTITSGSAYVVHVSPEQFYCLAEGTLITLADGTQKPIEEIRKGDILRGYDYTKPTYTTEAGETKVAKDMLPTDRISEYNADESCLTNCVVVSTALRGAEKEFDCITLDDGTTLLMAGEEHNFYSYWELIPKPHRSIKVGDALMGSDFEPKNVIKTSRVIPSTNGLTKYYSLVTSNNTYFANGILCFDYPYAKYEAYMHSEHLAVPEELKDLFDADMIWYTWQNMDTDKSLITKTSKSRDNLMRYNAELSESHDELNRYDYKDFKILEQFIDTISNSTSSNLVSNILNFASSVKNKYGDHLNSRKEHRLHINANEEQVEINENAIRETEDALYRKKTGYGSDWYTALLHYLYDMAIKDNAAYNRYLEYFTVTLKEKEAAEGFKFEE